MLIYLTIVNELGTDRDLKVIVFGSEGRLGKSVREVLRSQRYEGHTFHYINRTDLDLLNRNEIQSLISKIKPDALLNLAAVLTVRVAESQPNFSDFSTNLALFNNIYSVAVQNGVQRMVQPGSFHCFAPGTALPFSSSEVPEAIGLNFTTPYAAAKSSDILFYHSRSAWLRDSGANFKLVLLPNVFGPFGPSQVSKDHFIGATITRVLNAKKSGDLSISAHGNPNELREYLYGLDAAEGLLEILLSESETKDFSVLSSGHKFSLEECWQAITEEIGFSGRVFFESPNTEARRDMYFDTPTIESLSFRQQLRQTISWYQDRK